MMGEQVLFNAATSVDKESPLAKLLFRWDFDGDGVYDTKKSPDPGAGYTFQKAGRYRPKLEVTDENKRVSELAKSLLVRERCPAGMVSVVDDSARSFCMDRYEWPNREGKQPRPGVSWVEAKVACLDAGKRLCSAYEWESVCRNGSRNVYPYGDAYDKKKCPTEGKEIVKSGEFNECGSAGVSDMVGNVWEWVEDRQGDYPYMMGGSYRDGKDAHCGLKVPGTIAAKADDVGFRCCR
jgi:formylglycine-generating enzyme required for sulfatase activity